jgi:hypothetical protein
MYLYTRNMYVVYTQVLKIWPDPLLFHDGPQTINKVFAERIYGIAYHISSSPYYSEGIQTLGRH